MPRISRNLTIVGSVLLLHILVLWAMQTGLLRRVAEVVVPEVILVEIMAAPVANPAPAPQSQQKVQAKAPVPQVAPPRPESTVTPQPAPAPLALAPSAGASPSASVAHATTTTASPAASTGAAANAPAAPAKVELPSSSADYLNNPKAPYPALSKRLGEQGTVVVHVLIGVDGTASQASVKRSSGFERLDRAAVETALKWRYAPGKRAGVPEPMWHDITFNWMLN